MYQFHKGRERKNPKTPIHACCAVLCCDVAENAGEGREMELSGQFEKVVNIYERAGPAAFSEIVEEDACLLVDLF